MSTVTIFLISMSILKLSNVACRIPVKAYVVLLMFFLMSIGSMSHVNFKKWPCSPVEFKGQGSSHSRASKSLCGQDVPIFASPIAFTKSGVEETNCC